METVVFWAALLLIDISYMSLWYALALYTKRYDVVDSAWGLGFVLLAWVSLLLRANFGRLQIISAMLVSLWGLRLFVHLANRNRHRGADDPRYEVLKQKWGATEYRKAYTNIFLLQGLLIAIISIPVVILALTPQQPNALSYIGWVIALCGIGFEAVADWQLSRFIAGRPKKSHLIMQTGFWRYSRHPNYFGEVTTWWGAALVAISVGEWWGILGAIVITILITKVSGIPPLERRYQGNIEYEAYRRRTSVLVPRLPRT